MKFVKPPLKKNIFFLFLVIVLTGTAQVVAQQNPPTIDIAKILLSDTIDYRSVCFRDSLHKVTLTQLPALTFTRPPKMFSGTSMLHKQKKTGGFVSGCTTRPIP